MILLSFVVYFQQLYSYMIRIALYHTNVILSIIVFTNVTKCFLCFLFNNKEISQLEYNYGMLNFKR